MKFLIVILLLVVALIVINFLTDKIVRFTVKYSMIFFTYFSKDKYEGRTSRMIIYNIHKPDFDWNKLSSEYEKIKKEQAKEKKRIDRVNKLKKILN